MKLKILRDIIKDYGKDIGIEYEVVYLDEETMPEDAKGSPETKAQINAIIKIAKDEDWKHIAGEDKSEEYLSASKLGNKSTKDSNYIDITLQKNIKGKEVIVRINTVDIYKNGNLTKREAETARLINLKIIGEGKGNP